MSFEPLIFEARPGAAKGEVTLTFPGRGGKLGRSPVLRVSVGTASKLGWEAGQQLMVLAGRGEDAGKLRVFAHNKGSHSLGGSRNCGFQLPLGRALELTSIDRTACQIRVDSRLTPAVLELTLPEAAIPKPESPEPDPSEPELPKATPEPTAPPSRPAPSHQRETREVVHPSKEKPRREPEEAVAARRAAEQRQQSARATSQKMAAMEARKSASSQAPTARTVKATICAGINKASEVFSVRAANVYEGTKGLAGAHRAVVWACLEAGLNDADVAAHFKRKVTYPAEIYNLVDGQIVGAGGHFAAQCNAVLEAVNLAKSDDDAVVA